MTLNESLLDDFFIERLPKVHNLVVKASLAGRVIALAARGVVIGIIVPIATSEVSEVRAVALVALFELGIAMHLSQLFRGNS